ncbi:hypothetical protein [Methylocella sp. CPCC 101449]|uniref:hypothetical protein n=1 Tax=Methylocella sp. CPCC 101449 TaxID=2987531 RepID=UPI0028913568|nr:hypothetical protein [Methylocella sp. CPCC 101449]MDT2019449.1 hypothetical protein [Methylocella sp. CPCC 101449]
MATFNNINPSSQGSFERLQKLLTQKINHTHERIEDTRKLVNALNAQRESQLNRTDHEIVSLQREIAAWRVQLDDKNSELIKATDEIRKLRVEARSLDIHLKRLEAENASLRDQIDQMSAELDLSRKSLARLERDKLTAETMGENLKRRLISMHETAAGEIGRAVKALLTSQKGIRWKGITTQEQATLLIRSGVINPQKYLAYHKDVADAGMDAGRHYVLHGASEGRDPNGILRDLLDNLDVKIE